MRKKINLKDYVKKNNIPKYDVCGFCKVTPRTVDRWIEKGMPEQYFLMLKEGFGGKL